MTIWIQCALPIVVFHLSIDLLSPQQQVRHASLVIIQDHNSTSGKSWNGLALRHTRLWTFLACQGLMRVHNVYSQHHGKWENLHEMQDSRQVIYTCLQSNGGFYTLYSYIYSVPVLCFCFSYTTNHVHIEVLISQDKQILLRQLCSVSELTLLLAWRTPSFFHGLNSQEVWQYDLLSLFFANLQLINSTSVAELHPPVSDKPFSLMDRPWWPSFSSCWGF